MVNSADNLMNKYTRKENEKSFKDKKKMIKLTKKEEDDKFLIVHFKYISVNCKYIGITKAK